MVFVQSRITAERRKKNMQIKKCREADVARIGSFYDSVVFWLDSHINYPKWIYKVYPSEPSVRDYTAAGTQYVCMDGQEVVGAFVLNDNPQGNYQKGDWEQSLPDGEYMVLHALAIAPERQGHGIGAKVVRFCAEKTKAEGYKALRVDIVPGNTPAQKLYEKNGFRYAGTFDLERGIEGIPEFCLYELTM